MYKSIELIFSSKFIQLNSQITAGLTWRNLSIPPIFLPIKATNNELGNAILKALDNSIEMNPYDGLESFNKRDINEYQNFMRNEYNNLSKEYGFKTVNNLKKDLMQVEIDYITTFKFSPTANKKSNFVGLDSIEIPFNSTLELIGLTAKSAMLKCTSSYKGKLDISLINLD